MLKKNLSPRLTKQFTILLVNFFIGLVILINFSPKNIDVRPVARARRHLKAAIVPSNNDQVEYMHIIIHYHKTGHDLTRSLINIMSSEISGMKERLVLWNRRTMLRSFNKTTKVRNWICLSVLLSSLPYLLCIKYLYIPQCPSLKFQEGIFVLSAPNFFCNEKALAELLLSGRDTSFLKKNRNRVRRGLKIIHLVRNPFSLAVSNYNYHAQQPT